jgi:error-prone DNA polymerase
LLANKLMPASTLQTYPNRRLARACGIVTVRHWPERPQGAILITIEDETGNVKAIIWPKYLSSSARKSLGASLLGAPSV